MFNKRNETYDLHRIKEKRKRFNDSCNFYLGDTDEFLSPNIDLNVGNRKEGDRKSDNYKSKTNIYINLRWKHLDCGNIFEQAYFYILRAKVEHYCLKCCSNIDQQQTFLEFQEVFQDYSSLSFSYDIQLSRILPNSAILLKEKYESIKYPNVHVDTFGIINFDDQEFRVAIEHQGPQHYSFESYLMLSRPRDEARGIYRSDAEYRIDWEQSIKRDKAKVVLFKELNKDDYYLIHVSYTISVSKRAEYILNEFTRQTGKTPGQSDILDWF